MNRDRIAQWDNLKFLMIVCVVIGHALYYFNPSSDISKTIYLFIYTFHMPVFVFLTGLFSKNTVRNRRYESIIEYLALYLIMKTLETVGDYIAKGKLDFHFLWEDGPAWFALAMAAFLIATFMLKDYSPRYIMALAIFIGCIAGLDSHFGNHYASMRICVFYPIFLAGYYTRIGEEIEDVAVSGRHTRILQKGINKALRKLIAILILALVALVCMMYVDALYPYINFIKAKVAYTKLGIGLEGVLFRLACYILWTALIFAITELTPKRHYFWTWLGTRTMSTYIWHYIIIIMLVYPLNGREFLLLRLPKFYLPAVITIAIMIAIITAYLPSFRIRDKLKAK